MDMKRNTFLVSATVLALGVAAAAMAVARRDKKPTPERVLNECLRAAEQLETRVRTAVVELVA